MKIQIQFRNGKEPLTYEADSIAEAVRQAIEIKADLSDADLSDADLSNACLSDADLRRAYLTGANLYYADLSHADLSDAYLEDANLQRASLIGAKVQDKTLWDKRPFLSFGACGSANRTTLAFFFEDGSEPFIMCGCFKGGLSEFTERIQKKHAGTFHEEEYNAMAVYIRTIHRSQQQQVKK